MVKVQWIKKNYKSKNNISNINDFLFLINKLYSLKSQFIKKRHKLKLKYIKYYPIYVY